MRLAYYLQYAVNEVVLFLELGKNEVQARRRLSLWLRVWAEIPRGVGMTI
jgi:hypothetical protein